MKRYDCWFKQKKMLYIIDITNATTLTTELTLINVGNITLLTTGISVTYISTVPTDAVISV